MTVLGGLLIGLGMVITFMIKYWLPYRAIEISEKNKRMRRMTETIDNNTEVNKEVGKQLEISSSIQEGMMEKIGEIHKDTIEIRRDLAVLKDRNNGKKMLKKKVLSE